MCGHNIFLVIIWRHQKEVIWNFVIEYIIIYLCENMPNNGSIIAILGLGLVWLFFSFYVKSHIQIIRKKIGTWRHFFAFCLKNSLSNILNSYCSDLLSFFPFLMQRHFCFTEMIWEAWRNKGKWGGF